MSCLDRLAYYPGVPFFEETVFYLAYVHKDPGSAYGVTLPDFPGCFTAADDLQELPQQVQEAVDLHFEGESLSIPVPTTPDDWAGDDRFQGGCWMLVDINVAALNE